VIAAVQHDVIVAPCMIIKLSLYKLAENSCLVLSNLKSCNSNSIARCTINRTRAIREKVFRSRTSLAVLNLQSLALEDFARPKINALLIPLLARRERKRKVATCLTRIDTAATYVRSIIKARTFRAACWRRGLAAYARQLSETSRGIYSATRFNRTTDRARD